MVGRERECEGEKQREGGRGRVSEGRGRERDWESDEHWNGESGGKVAKCTLQLLTIQYGHPSQTHSLTYTPRTLSFASLSLFTLSCSLLLSLSPGVRATGHQLRQETGRVCEVCACAGVLRRVQIHIYYLVQAKKVPCFLNRKGP
jgi:hypothetical protein